MPAPSAAVAHQDPMSPFDRVEYISPFTALLEEGEKIASARLALYPEAVALGFTILEGEGVGPAVLNDNTIRIWVEVAEDMREQAVFATGVRIPYELTITTDAVPFRRFKRTQLITVVNL